MNHNNGFERMVEIAIKKQLHPTNSLGLVGQLNVNRRIRIGWGGYPGIRLVGGPLDTISDCFRPRKAQCPGSIFKAIFCPFWASFRTPELKSIYANIVGWFLLAVI
jgi:hypothetical protein